MSKSFMELPFQSKDNLVKVVIHTSRVNSPTLEKKMHDNSKSFRKKSVHLLNSKTLSCREVQDGKKKI